MAPDPKENGGVDQMDHDAQPPPAPKAPAAKDAKKKKEDLKKDEDLVSHFGATFCDANVFGLVCAYRSFPLGLLACWCSECLLWEVVSTLQFRLMGLCPESVQSEEDLALKEQLELYVERVQDSDAGVQKLALESMRFVYLRKFWLPGETLIQD